MTAGATGYAGLRQIARDICSARAEERHNRKVIGGEPAIPVRLHFSRALQQNAGVNAPRLDELLHAVGRLDEVIVVVGRLPTAVARRALVNGDDQPAVAGLESWIAVQ